MARKATRQIREADPVGIGEADDEIRRTDAAVRAIERDGIERLIADREGKTIERVRRERAERRSGKEPTWERGI